jgi:hypothetical protein
MATIRKCCAVGPTCKNSASRLKPSASNLQTATWTFGICIKNYLLDKCLHERVLFRQTFTSTVHVYYETETVALLSSDSTVATEPQKNSTE